MEVGTRILKKQLVVAFKMRDISEARCYLDSFSVTSAPPPVTLRQFVHPQFRGSWFEPDNVNPQATVLYFHGGGYSFYPRAYAHFIAQIALAANCKTFALDYRLSPEHRFPAQLEDALNAYRWLLDEGVPPRAFVVMGDSAGGNLTLALLLAARDAKLPLPALAILLSPPTGLEVSGAGNSNGRTCDWIDRKMLEQWFDWFCDPTQHRNPLVSPVYADLRGLPPIYMQAGRAEILFSTIQAFADRGRDQGADILLDAWEDMTHDFQVFVPYAPQSAEALRRIGEVIHARIRGEAGPKTSAADA
jgi:epsilon-lactone hydrolase